VPGLGYRLVSKLMDISSEMIHAFLPVYMATVLGTSTLMVGVIEGVAEATTSITKIFSGALSDWKPLYCCGAQSVGLPLALVPAVLVVMGMAYALSAYPVGALSDRMDRVMLLITGLFFL
jgi:hypothetical protein